MARERGLLASLKAAGADGLSPEEASRSTGLGIYAARVLLEGCAAAGAATEEGGRFRLGGAGLLLLDDALVRANLDFSHDVCFQGAFRLEESLDSGAPEGLKVFGPWDTIYEGLEELPERVRRSWLAFDHLYSDGAFPTALERVLDRPVRRLLDVGGNTGRWAMRCLAARADLEVTLADHPAVARRAAEAAHGAGLGARLIPWGADLLDPSLAFPAGFDVVWMSQFLDCFAEEDAVGLLRRGREALAPGGRLMVLEPCWDRQPNAAAKDAVMAVSLYFTCMANGRSRMFHSSDLERAFAAAGLKVEARETIGYHTLFTCAPA